MLRLASQLAKALHAFLLGLLALPREASEALADPAHMARALFLILPIALAASCVLPRLTLVMTPSIDAWIVHPAPGPITKGDLVMLRLLHPMAGPQPVSITKYALCLSGDRLTMSETPSRLAQGERDGHYFCNGALLGVSLPHGVNGIKLDHARWQGIIPAGLAYVGSHHRRGFDSRYFGLVPISRLTRVERLL